MEKQTKKTNKKTRQKSEKIEFTKDTTLGEVIAKKPDAQMILLGFGMHCFGCFISDMETLEEAAMVHDISLDLLLQKLNEL